MNTGAEKALRAGNLRDVQVDTAGGPPHKAAMGGLELWGGHECSLNRVGDVFRDQTVLSGHQTRIDDLERFAALGVSALRYPALWERTELQPGVRTFAWLDARLARLTELKVRPILTLVHHGSGPRWTDLLDDGFAPGLAAHARAVARRYPDVADYTPVNEPLTTARFSALYGHWHPHAREPALFWRAFLNQIDAIRLSMAAIEDVNPRARLVQTEDLGVCQSTPRLADQARFENERRWLTWDLLCGHVTSDHPLHAHIAGYGMADRLARIADDPRPPDVIGINHYVTSDRYLDEDPERYPPETRGGNARLAYADVEAVRVRRGGTAKFEDLLHQAWERYARPLALTEVHIGCTRDEQLRWFLEGWSGAEAARARGACVVAVTAWSLLGAFGWNELLRSAGAYESGVFDVSTGKPRRTVLAKLLRRVASGQVSCPVAQTAGWWRRDDERAIYR